MDIAIKRRRENIAEYILYLWQIEDLLRALQFSPEAIFSQLVAPRNLDETEQQTYLLWYMDIANLLREEHKEQSGHLDHTLHLIEDMHQLHLRLMQLPIGAEHRLLFAKVEPHLAVLRERLQGRSVSDTELCFRALYATMLYRIKGQGEKAVEDTLQYISPVVAHLTATYHAVERGEIDLFKD